LDYVDHESATLYVSGVDVVDGSAVLDIKPYHPVDSLCGQLTSEDLRFADWLPEPRASAEVTWSARALDELQHLQSLCKFYPDVRDSEDLKISGASKLLRSSVEEVIGLDPRPPQSRRPNKIGKAAYGYWAMDFDGLSVVFRSPGQGPENCTSKFEVVRILEGCDRRTRSSKEWLQELQAELEGEDHEFEAIPMYVYNMI